MYKFLLASFLMAASSGILPAAVLYDVTIDTSSLTGDGALSLQIGVTGDPDPLSVSLRNFAIPGGSLNGLAEKCFGALPCPITGELPGDTELIFDNSENFAEYFQTLTWGSSLSFQLIFQGAAITNPTLGAGASSFEVFLLDANGIEGFLSTDPLGTLLAFEVDETGILASNFSNAGTADVSLIPEPSVFVLSLLGLSLVALRYRRFAVR